MPFPRTRSTFIGMSIRLPRRHRVRLCIASAAFVAGCAATDSERPIEFCTRELGASLTPRDTVISVGANFSASIALSTCGGRQQLEDTFTWRTADTVVVRVSASGVATASVLARTPGHADIEVVGAHYGSVGRVRVTVGSP